MAAWLSSRDRTVSQPTPIRSSVDRSARSGCQSRQLLEQGLTHRALLCCSPAETNYPAPASLLSGNDWTQHVTEVNAKAGDAVIFSEVRK